MILWKSFREKEVRIMKHMLYILLGIFAVVILDSIKRVLDKRYMVKYNSYLPKKIKIIIYIGLLIFICIGVYSISCFF